jgi:predicted transcriptional regulator
MRITTVNLPDELHDRIDQVARDSERSRSFVVRKLLEHSLNAQDRLATLQAIADAELEDGNASRPLAPNATAVISGSCIEGHRRLAALGEIAAGNRHK